MTTTPQMRTEVAGALTATESGLPEGWVLARLGEVCIPPQYGWTTSADKNGKGLKLLRTTDISGGKVDWSTVPACRDEPVDPEKYLLKQGDIVVSRAGSVGVSYLIEEAPKAIFASYLIRFRPWPPVQSEFIAFFLKSLQYWSAIAEESAGIAIPNVNASKLKQIKLPLPPIPEQKRIVTKIEELLTQVNASRERLAKVPKILKRFRQSVLAAACTGRLTAELRDRNPEVEPAVNLTRKVRQLHDVAGFGHGGKAADPSEGVHTLEASDFPDTWDVLELKWLCKPGKPITYGILKPGPNQPDGVPYVRVADFPKDRLVLKDLRRTTKEIAHEYRRSTLQAGDVLLSIRGTVGRVCRVPRRLDGANITQDTARISVHEEISGDYIELYLRSRGVQRRLEAAMRGVAVRGVNIGDVRALQVVVPPVEEQHEIVRRVEALFNLADTIEKRVAAATTRAEKLSQSILAKAFRGELVPTEVELARREGRDYEPASVLLDRLRAERAEKEKTKPQRRTPQRRTRRRKRQSA